MGNRQAHEQLAHLMIGWDKKIPIEGLVKVDHVLVEKMVAPFLPLDFEG